LGALVLEAAAVGAQQVGPGDDADHASWAGRGGHAANLSSYDITSRIAQRYNLPMPTALSERDYRALARFRHALRVFLRFSEQAARHAGLAPNQHQLLLAIRGWDGTHGPTIGDIALQLQLQHHSVVELVNRAVLAGPVVRQPDPDDRRRQRLALTDHGARKIATLSAAHRDELQRFRQEMTNVLDELR
jgi:DNA-binding MarR family transcriptional regulator